ncbi:MAG: hypothetical protein CXT73_06520 [Methanobacteriota archaeon]|nr:MAG: hypothetical protein CXT73_06520 [Euryarchaeota archaeon]
MNEETQIIPYDTGFCDCCLDENVKILTCSSNNKCEYRMCLICIKNLKVLTEQKKCPACREEIFKSSDDEADTNEINIEIEERRSERIRLLCCGCFIVENDRCIRIRREIDRILNCYRHYCYLNPTVCCVCCIIQLVLVPIIIFYDIISQCFQLDRIRYDKIRYFIGSILMLIITGIFVLFFRLVYSIYNNEYISLYFFGGVEMFWLKAFIGMTFFFVTSIVCGMSICCIFNVCCVKEDAW